MGSQKNSYVNLTSSAVAKGGECWVEGMYVNSTSSLMLKLVNRADAGADINGSIAGFITPAAGYHYLGNLHCTAGLYVGFPTGSGNITLHIREQD